MLDVGITVVCRSPETYRGSPPLPCQNYTFSRGFLESLLSLAGSQSYFRLPFCLVIPCIIFFLFCWKKHPSLQGTLVVNTRGLFLGWTTYCYLFLRIYTYTRPIEGQPTCTHVLFQLSMRSHACCFSDSSVLDMLLFV
jgi:hypothetical protein